MSDGLHEARTRVEVDLLDRNDHAPVIIGPSEIRIAEDIAVRSRIAGYEAEDRDRDDRARSVIFGTFGIWHLERYLGASGADVL